MPDRSHPIRSEIIVKLPLEPSDDRQQIAAKVAALVDGARIPAIVVTSPGVLRDFLRRQAEQILEHARQCKFPAERAELEQLARDCLLKVEAIEREQ